MNARSKGTCVVLTLLLLVATFGFAQVNASNLVNVNVSNIKTDIAKNINVDVSQIPVTVQAPIDVAAAVCGIGVDVLTSQVAQGNNTCTAKSTNTALNTIVQNQIKQQTTK
jgi:hypothetical protein